MVAFGPEHVVAITGASAGVGRATALAFARLGCKIALIARGEENLEVTASEVEGLGGRALPIVCDVGEAEELTVAVAAIEKHLGPVDLWINNAMVTIYSPVADMTVEEFEQVTRVTYLGQVFATKAVLPSMRRRNRGTILFINSALGVRSIPFQAPYCAAKAAVRGFVDSLRSELQWEGKAIRLSSIYLPAVNTPQFDWAANRLGRHPAPVAPIFQPEAIADAIVKAASKAPREVWLGGSTVKAIMGQLFAPGLVDRLLARRGIANETTADYAAMSQGNLFEPGHIVPAHGGFDDQATGAVTSFNPAWMRFGASCAAVATVGALVLASLKIANDRDRAA